jgi:glucokinase
MQRLATPDAEAAHALAPGRHAIGIDVGGSKIAGGIVNLGTGAVAARQQVPTGCERGGGPVLDTVADLVRGLRAEAGALAIGIASDVRAAALAEARFGAGRGVRDFYYVTIGTGISGVLVLDGVPYAGTRGAALVIANGRAASHCGACGHVEARVIEDVASGPALAAAFRPGATAEEVLVAAAQGAPRAVAVTHHATQELGRVLALMADALDPACLVIGGGLGSAPGAYFDGLTRAIRAGLWEGDRHLPILQAALGPDAGLIGAALSIFVTPEPANRPPQRTT